MYDDNFYNQKEKSNKIEKLVQLLKSKKFRFGLFLFVAFVVLGAFILLGHTISQEYKAVVDKEGNLIKIIKNEEPQTETLEVNENYVDEIIILDDPWSNTFESPEELEEATENKPVYSVSEEDLDDEIRNALCEYNFEKAYYILESFIGEDETLREKYGRKLLDLSTAWMISNDPYISDAMFQIQDPDVYLFTFYNLDFEFQWREVIKRNSQVKYKPRELISIEEITNDQLPDTDISPLEISKKGIKIWRYRFLEYKDIYFDSYLLQYTKEGKCRIYFSQYSDPDYNPTTYELLERTYFYTE